jgi:hypothetical protein
MLAALLPAWFAVAHFRATSEVDFLRGRGERSGLIASVAFRKFKALRETSLTLLPNHALNPDGELEGFVFECCAERRRRTLPEAVS